MELAPQDLAIPFYNQYRSDLSDNEVILLLMECLSPVIDSLSHKLAVFNSVVADAEELRSDMLEKLVLLVQAERGQYVNRIGEFWRVVWTGLQNHAIDITRKERADRRLSNLVAQSYEDIEWLLSSIDASLEFQMVDFLRVLPVDSRYLVESVVYSDYQLMQLMQQHIANKSKKSPQSTFSRIPYAVLMEYTGWSRSKLYGVISQTKELYRQYLKGSTMHNSIYVKPLNDPAPQSVVEQVKDAIQYIDDPNNEPKFVVPQENRKEFQELVGEMMDQMRNGEYCVIAPSGGLLNVIICATENKAEPQVIKKKKEGKQKLSLKAWENKITTQAWRDLTHKTKPMTAKELIAWAEKEHQITLACNSNGSSQATKATLTRQLLKALKIDKYKSEYQDKTKRERARFV